MLAKWEDYATKVVDLIKSDGDTIIGVVKDVVTLAKAVSEKDFGTVFLTLNTVAAGVKDVVKKVKKTFDLN